jgi:Glyoxalase-like domain
MSASKPRVRLRQAVLVAEDLEQTASRLRSALDLEEPFRDPGVGEFGLANAVFAVGDCFLEVISPTQPGTAAGRHLERHGGDGGYMAIFDLEDLEGARERVGALGVRVVWRIDLPDISGTHLHPADMRGAIVSLDRSNPYGAWRWGGPQWTAQLAAPAPGQLAGITLAVGDPEAVAGRWGEVLALEVEVEVERSEWRLLGLEDGEVGFRQAASEREEGIVEIALALPSELPGGLESIELGGVRLRRVAGSG